MYTLKSEQYSTVENWVNSLPDSLVKGNYIKWLSELKSKERLTTDELEKFVALSSALPVEFQSFPQNFSLSVKNITADASDIVSETKETSKKETKSKK